MSPVAKQSLSLTEDTHGGVAGLRVAEPVGTEHRNATVGATTPGPKTEGEAAVDWEKLENQEDVTHAGAEKIARILEYLKMSCHLVTVLIMEML